MARVRPENDSNPWWQGYQTCSPSTQRLAFDSSYHVPEPTISHLGQSQKSTYRSSELPSTHAQVSSGDETGILTASPQSPNPYHSYPPRKRAFQDTDDSQYGGLQTFPEDLLEIPKSSINLDHRLLSFGRPLEKNTILDDRGCIQRIHMAAQIHGMFFLSELATPSGESLLAQPELTCYRRNLFQISGSVTAPRGALSTFTEDGERVPIVSKEVVVSATESVDGQVVKLIVIPWKTKPPNSPDIPTGQDHEPVPIPLVPFDEETKVKDDYTIFPIAYRRLQFRIATANNGRRRELQQHFTLHLNVIGTLPNGTKIDICETSTVPIVVRGRSPRNFQARKEIPLPGSSSARGQPPELHISTKVIPVTSATDNSFKSANSDTPQAVEWSRSAFVFDSRSISGSPSMARQPTYQAWNVAHPSDQSTTPVTPNYAAPVDSYFQFPQNSNLVSDYLSNVPTTAIHLPMRQSYPHRASSAASISEPFHFVDHNPRPTKAARHSSASPSFLGLTANRDYFDFGTRYGTPYSSEQDLLPSRMPEYLPLTLPWTPRLETGSVYGTSMARQNQAMPQQQQQYDFANGHQNLEERNDEDRRGSDEAHFYAWNVA